LIGAKKLVVEVDAQYIKGMLNKPDLHPNAAMNRWIAVILMFDFELVHVPGTKHKGPDGLSRRRVADSEEEGEGIEEAEGWVDEIIGAGVWVASGFIKGSENSTLGIGKDVRCDEDAALERKEDEGWDGWNELMQSRKAEEGISRREKELREIRNFLETMKMPEKLTEKVKQQFLQYASKFFLKGGKMWRREHQGRHQQVIEGHEKHYQLLTEAYDQLGHKGFYATRRTLNDRFWWPTLNADIRWIVSTCHQCQVLSLKHVVLPPTIQVPAPLFRKAYVDTMHMPPSQGYKYIVQARDSLTGWPEWRALTRETGRTLGQFIFEELLCRWGGLEEIVTDNGTPFVAALEWIAT